MGEIPSKEKTGFIRILIRINPWQMPFLGSSAITPQLPIIPSSGLLAVA
jgi:hypothetical protein